MNNTIIKRFLLVLVSYLYCSPTFLQSMSVHMAAKKAIEEGQSIDLNKICTNIFEPTPLISAAAYGDLDTIKLFLAYGADINHTDKYGSTALSIALFYRQFETAIFLLDNGALSYIKDVNGKTALDELNINFKYHKNQKKQWPKKLLSKLQGKCCICLEDICEIGLVYECGHSVHKNCATSKYRFCRK